MRDLRAIGTKIVQVLNPTSENAVLRDWDLWGPLIVRSCALLLVHLLTSSYFTVLPRSRRPPLHERFALLSSPPLLAADL